MNLDLLRMRGELNKIDHQIVDLLIRRFTILEKIFSLKKQEQIKFYDPIREREILDMASEQTGGDKATSFVLAVVRSMLIEGRNHIKPREDGHDYPNN